MNSSKKKPAGLFGLCVVAGLGSSHGAHAQTGVNYTQYSITFTTGSNASVQIGNGENNGSTAVTYTDDWTLTEKRTHFRQLKSAN